MINAAEMRNMANDYHSETNQINRKNIAEKIKQDQLDNLVDRIKYQAKNGFYSKYFNYIGNDQIVDKYYFMNSYYGNLLSYEDVKENLELLGYKVSRPWLGFFGVKIEW